MAYERTWGFSANNLYTPSSLADTAKFTLWSLKAFLTGQYGGLVGSGLWTVEGSSDAVTGGMDGVDRWTATYTPSLIVRAAAQGTAHSWIALKSPVLTTGINARILIDYVAGTDQTCLFQHSRNAFTGGTNLTGPSGTAVGAMQGATTTTATQFVSSSAGAGIVHKYNCILSTSGDFVHWFIRSGSGGLAELTTMVFGPAQTKAVDQYPYWAWKGFTNAGTGASASNMGNTSASCTIANYLGTIQPAVFSIPFATAGLDQADSTLVDFPAYVAIVNGGVTIGMRGRLPDVGTSPGNAGTISTPTGSTIRDASNNVIYTTVGLLVVPYNTLMDTA